jgi:hypothetical protein
MKDSILLLLTGVAVAAAAWGFWHFLGSDAFAVFTAMALATLALDNMRLRRLRRKD